MTTHPEPAVPPTRDVPERAVPPAPEVPEPPALDEVPSRPSRMPVYVTLGGLTLALVLVFVAASGARQTTPPPPVERAGTADAPRDVTVIMREYAFAPAPLALVPGETVRFTILNGGLVAHELVLGDATVQAAWASLDAGATLPGPFATAPPVTAPAGLGGLRIALESGRQVVVTYQVPSDQALTLVCHLPGHLERGMSAAVVLTQPGTQAR